MKIGIVEDDTVLAWLLEEVCRGAGHQIVGTASAPGSAMSLIEGERPDCLLLDFNLPGEQDGLELLEQAKRVLPSLFTVMITGWDINDIVGRIGALQPDRILRKPVHPATLLAILNHASRKRGSADAPRRSAIAA